MHPKYGAMVALRAAHIAGRADRKIEKPVRSELQNLPAVMPLGRQPVGDDHGSGRVVQSGLDVVEAEDGADGRHVERSVAERDPARHPQPRCGFAHALAAPVTVFVGHCEDAPFPAGADKKGAFLAPGHLPSVGDFREGLDDEALREMDGGEAIVLDRPDRPEESGGEKQGQDESSHDPTHMWEALRLPIYRGKPAMFRRHPSASAIKASTCRRAGASLDPRALYRRAASTMIRPRPRRSK